MITVEPVEATLDEAYLDSVESRRNPHNYVEYITALDSISGARNEDVEILRLLLSTSRFSARHATTGELVDLGQPARVEVFYEFDKPHFTIRRGLLLFNQRRQPLLHVLNATMDVSPSSREPNLTARILEFIGAPGSLFYQGLDQIDNGPFLLAFTREQEDEPHGVGRHWRAVRLR